MAHEIDRPHALHHINIPVAFEFQPIEAQWSIVQTPDGELLQCRDGSEGKTFAGRLARKPLDPWAMRDEFFHLKAKKAGSTKSLVEFLNKWGTWKSFSDPKTVWDIFPRPDTWRPDHMWERQKRFMEALTSDPESWLTQTATSIVTGDTLSLYPYRQCLASGCEYALIVTITADLLNKVEFGICAREDCRKPFALTDPRKIFCDQYCGHITSVRKGRKKLPSKEAIHAGKN
jgi:hypothetical protein